MREFLSLKENAHFVKGPVNGAIYDLQEERIQRVPKTLADIMSACILEGMPVDTALERILSNTGPLVKDKMRDLLMEHPLLCLTETPRPYQPIRASLDESLDMIWLELTPRCNLRCLHCYATAGPDVPSCSEISAERWQEIVREAAEMGFPKIQFTGGEPLLYPELVSLLRTAREAGFEVIEVYTNLTLLSDELVEEFKSSGIRIATSFYSYDDRTHNEITQNRSSYQATVSNIKKILSAGIPIRIGVILMEQNISHEEETREFLIELGISEDEIGFDYVRRSGRGLQMPFLRDDVSPTRLKKDCRDRLVWNSCWTGKIAVKSDGSVSPCVFVREAMDSVKHKSLAEVVSCDRLKRCWETVLDEVEVCRDCEFRYGCHDCRANALNHTSELRAKNPLCAYNPYTGIWEKDFERYSGVKPRRQSEMRWEELGESILLYDSLGNFSILNPTAAMVWSLCDGEHSIEEIADEFLFIYEADTESVFADVKRMVGELAVRGLLTISDGRSAMSSRELATANY